MTYFRKDYRDYKKVNIDSAVTVHRQCIEQNTSGCASPRHYTIAEDGNKSRSEAVDVTNPSGGDFLPALRQTPENKPGVIHLITASDSKPVMRFDE